MQISSPQILSSTVDQLHWAIQKWDYHSNVELVQKCHYGQDRILEYDINWSACGSCSIDETVLFIDNLSIAYRLAAVINQSRYEVVSIDSLQGPDLPESIRQQKIAEDRATVEKLADWLGNGRWTCITRWIEEQRID